MRRFMNRFKKQDQRFKRILIGGCGLLWGEYIKEKKETRQCGIVGIVSNQRGAEKYLMEGIEILQNRGYDSCGMGLLSEKEWVIHKLATDYSKKVDCIGKLKELIKEKYGNESGFLSGIGHTRWATCGAKTDENAHPHQDFKKRISLVHNGTLDNLLSMKADLAIKGISLLSQTDTELIAQYIGYYICQPDSNNLLKATLKTISTNLSGHWAIVAIDNLNPTQMLVARKGSPLLIGLSNDTFYVASEKVAFEKYTTQYIALEDNEVLLLDLKKMDKFKEKMSERIRVIKDISEVQLKPSLPYRYFYEQEMYQQPESIMRVLGNGSRLCNDSDQVRLGGLENSKQSIKNIQNMLIIGCGSSLYAGQFATNIFKYLHCFNTIQCIEASEFHQSDLPQQNPGAIFISQSGETADIFKCLTLSKHNGLFTIGVVNTVQSLIANNVHCGVYLNCGREVAVPATKSFTSQIVVLILIAIYISNIHDTQQLYAQRRMELKSSLRNLPNIIAQTINNISYTIQQIALSLRNVTSLFILGKGISSSIAKEGALKIKEVTYIHAEAFSAGEMKHGPIALLDSNKNKESKVILMIFEDEYLNDMQLTLSEMHSRNAHTIVITDCLNKLDKNKIDQSIELIKIQYLTPLISIIVFQKLSLEICLLNDINPDKPRNLAKTVTVG